MTFKLYSVDLVAPVEVSEPIDISELATGGIVATPYMATAGENSGTLTCKMSKKSIQRVVRVIQTATGGSNNWRKRHGLPMYRRVRW